MKEIRFSQSTLVYILFVIFTFSGFTGLIYESIWTRYLKLFLGHAAYAQTLVLSIFMGGLALGSWISSRKTTQWKNLFLAYAAVEGIIGLLAVLFHPAFTSATTLSYETIMPAIGAGSLVEIYRWILAALLTLPQSILLGMTFPLLSAGIIRLNPANSGSSLAMLYFTNSLGAAIGVLASGYILIDWIGLPGTIIFAGFINIILALVVWLLTRHIDSIDETEAHILPDKLHFKAPVFARMVSIALLTGTSSFIYEIAWIRMLSLVMGSSTHAFEMMLSAFIFGLAMGGLWIKSRIDQIKNTYMFLAVVQIAMGLLALATIPMYNHTFDFMQFILATLKHTDSGYILFNITSNIVAIAVMLPATFCAGMTLPLITNILIKSGGGEKAIGRIYAANTLGSIIGVIFSINIGLTLLGLKWLLVVGVIIDIGLGLFLIYLASGALRFKYMTAAASMISFILVLILGIFSFDLTRLASGVFRTGHSTVIGSVTIPFYKDGKTASVSITQRGSVKSIRTNGKPDAAMNTDMNGSPQPDENTMVLAAAMPLSIKPSVKTIANIGLGSGLTTHTLLTSPTIKRVDTIEIEPAMVEGAKLFGARVERTFNDKRSHIYFNDAKAFFAITNNKYDMIVSEPSNPWVSGTANLFTQEFYTLINKHLNKGGLFVQWMHAYEFNIDLFSSIIKALSKRFKQYEIFQINNGDLLIIASNTSQNYQFHDNIFHFPELSKLIRRVGINSLDDLNLTRVGNKANIEYAFYLNDSPVNSDYYPYLDLNAVKARFLHSYMRELIDIQTNPVPVYDLVNARKYTDSPSAFTYLGEFATAAKASIALHIRDMILENKNINYSVLNANDREYINAIHTAKLQILILTMPHDTCSLLDDNELFNAFFNIANTIVPFLKPHELNLIWERLQSFDCMRRLTNTSPHWFQLIKAVGGRNAEAIISNAIALKKQIGSANNLGMRNYLEESLILGYLGANQPTQAYNEWLYFIKELRAEGIKSTFLLNYLGILSRIRSIKDKPSS